MIRPRGSAWLAAAAAAALLGSAAGESRGEAADAVAPGENRLTAEQIDACVRANLPDETTRQFLSFELTDRSGLVERSAVESFWKRDPEGKWRLLARFLSPENVRGTAVLMHEREHGTDIFVFLPDLRRVRRIHKRTIYGAIAGTDLSYEDWERIQGLVEDPRLERLPDSEIDGRAVYVVEAFPNVADDTAYTRVMSWVDRRTCIIVRAEIYEFGDQLRKVVTVPLDAIWPEGDGWIARYMLVEDVRNGSRTSITVDEIAMDEPIPDRFFSQRELESGEH